MKEDDETSDKAVTRQRGRSDDDESSRSSSVDEVKRQYELLLYSPPPASEFEREAEDALRDGYPGTYRRFRRSGMLDPAIKRLGESAAIVTRQVWQHLVNQGDAPGPALMTALDVARSQMQDEIASIAGPQRI